MAGKKHELDLYQNSIDSLNESIKYYKMSLADESKYKFCILLSFHFCELMFKHLVEHINPLLCFTKPFSDNIEKEKTVSWKQAIQILINNGMSISQDEKKVFDRLADIRNEIMHYKFSYETSNIRNIIINSISCLRKLTREKTEIDFYDDVDGDTKSFLIEIEDENKKELHLAKSNAQEEADDKNTYDCFECGEKGTVVKRDDKYYCYFCKEEDYEVECSRCTELFRASELNFYGENDYGDNLYFCDSCEEYSDRD
jgi:hypothetical protein